jgi:hypothetical protein
VEPVSPALALVSRIITDLEQNGTKDEYRGSFPAAELGFEPEKPQECEEAFAEVEAFLQEDWGYIDIAPGFESRGKRDGYVTVDVELRYKKAS